MLIAQVDVTSLLQNHLHRSKAYSVDAYISEIFRSLLCTSSNRGAGCGVRELHACTHSDETLVVWGVSRVAKYLICMR